MKLGTRKGHLSSNAWPCSRQQSCMRRCSFRREIGGRPGVQGHQGQWPLARQGLRVHLDCGHPCQITLLSHVTPGIPSLFHSFPSAPATPCQSFPRPFSFLLLWVFLALHVHILQYFFLRQFCLFVAFPVLYGGSSQIHLPRLSLISNLKPKSSNIRLSIG